MKVSLSMGTALLALFAQTAPAQYAELEPNDTKVQALANGVFVLGPGGTLTGTSTGGTVTLGLTSADYWLVQTTALPPGIYRHRLVATSAIVGHGMTLRGSNYGLGTEASLQSSSAGTTPPRFVQWYGFGRSERLYVRVSGGVFTTAPYTLTLETTPVSAGAVPGAFTPGSLTLSSIGLTTVDTEVHIYDGGRNEIFDYQNDDPFGLPGVQCQLTRPFAAGVYYAAVSRFNQFSTHPSPSGLPGDPLHFYPGSQGGEKTRSRNVFDFPDVACVSSFTFAAASASFTITDSAASPLLVLVPASFGEPYEILWFQFTVGGSTCTGPVITSHPSSLDVCYGNSVSLSVSATGTGPLFYSWSFNGSPISGANSSSLAIPFTEFSFAGSYACQVSNACGQVNSLPGTLTVHPAGPEIVAHPGSLTRCIGECAEFTVVALARMAGVLSYQWHHDDQPVPGATASTLQFTVGSLADAGHYMCRVTEQGCGAADSSAALLTVRNAAPVISLIGNPIVNLECGVSTYTEQGATVTDDCDTGLTATIGGQTVDTQMIGHYMVTYDAVDSQGNQAVTVRRDVFVVDSIRPTVQVAVASTVLWSPNHEMVNVGLSVQTSDACDPLGAAANVAVQVFGDEVELPDTGDGSGQHSPDALNIAPTQLRLRSERRGNSDGRVYLIVVSTSDASGNVGFGFATVVCPSSQTQTALATAQAQADAIAAQLATTAAGTQRLDDVVQALTAAGYMPVGVAPAAGPHQ